MTTIAQFYAGRSVFITGGTGFIGKVLVEKLLRSCPQIEQIYLLMRPKRGLGIERRTVDFIDSKAFDELRRTQPSFARKVVPVLGDVGQDGLGLSDADRARLTNNVQVAFHSAGLVSFSAPLQVAFNVNVGGTRRVLQLCEEMKSLDSLVHVSTAYSNPHLLEINEEVYEPALRFDVLQRRIATLTKEQLAVEEEELLRSSTRYNTYFLTKGIAEKMLITERENVPLCITRPSVVGAAIREPLPGWMNGRSGWTGLMIAAGRADLKYFDADPEVHFNIIPVDYVVKGLVAAGLNTALRKEEKKDDVLVYNLTAGNEKGMRSNFRTLCEETTKNVREFPLSNLRIKPYMAPSGRRFVELYNACVHLPKCHFFDVLLRLKGEQPHHVQRSQEATEMVTRLRRFLHSDPSWAHGNLMQALNRMDEADRKEYAYDMKNFDFAAYLRDYWLGIRRHVLREPEPPSRAKTQAAAAAQTRQKFAAESHVISSSIVDVKKTI